MANPVLHESKHILKRVLIGVATGVSGAVIIYFLGYNRNRPVASEAEIKKNTVKAWNTYIDIENNALVNFDSNAVKANRSFIMYNKQYRQKDSVLNDFRKRDSLQFVQSMDRLDELRLTKDIDKDFAILLGTRMAYIKEELSYAMDYKAKFGALLMDSLLTEVDRANEIQETNKAYNTRMQNIVERIGRSVEDLAEAIAKKYQYPFSMAGLKYYPYYLTLKKAKNLQPKKPGVAPPDPNKPAPDLPD